MEGLSAFQSVAVVIFFGVFPVLLIGAMIYSLWYKDRNVSTLIAQSGWKHEKIKKGAVERRFCSTTNGIDWTMEFKISQSDSKNKPAQINYPTILEWHTSAVKLPAGSAVIVTTPIVDREAMGITYRMMLEEVDVWLGSDLSPYHLGSINFQSRFTVMAETEENARQVVDAAESPLLQWPEWEISRLVAVPTPVLMADTGGITIRIGLHRLSVPSNVQKLDNPFTHRVFAVVQLGVMVATRMRNAG